MVLAVDEKSKGKLFFFATEKGRVKKTDLMAYSNIRSSGIIAIVLNEDDRLIAVRETTGASDVLLPQQNGMAIRFSEDNVRTMGRTAAGVRGIDLGESDRVVGCVTFDREETDGEEVSLLTVTTNGFGKRTVLTAICVVEVPSHAAGKG